MIIFGSRMYGKKDVLEGLGRCGECGHYGQLSNYNARKWGHIYYIPLIPSGPPVRVVKECPKCKKGLHIPEIEVEETMLEMRRDADAAIDAIAGGSTEYNRDGSSEPQNCLGAIFGNIDFFLCLGGREHVESIMRRLGERQRGYEQQFVSAAVCEFEGDLKAAAGAYETAARLTDRDRLPLLLAGEMWFAAGELDRALDAYRRASSLDPHDLDALQGMIDVHTAQNDYRQMSEVYERAMSIAPDLRNEKKIMKAYKKACKKANRPAQLA
jgi:tetratricopeptide (TPR) repeat protein